MERSGPETCNKTQWGEASPQYFPTERQVQTDPQWNMTTPGPRDFRKVSQSDYSAHFFLVNITCPLPFCLFPVIGLFASILGTFKGGQFVGKVETLIM